MPRVSEYGGSANSYYITGKIQRLEEEIAGLKHDGRRASAYRRELNDAKVLSLRKVINKLSELWDRKGMQVISIAHFDVIAKEAEEWRVAYVETMALHDKAIRLARQLAAKNREIAERDVRREAAEKSIREMDAQLIKIKIRKR